MIPIIAEELGLKNVPQWPGEVFDRAWIFNFSGGQLSNFSNIGEHLLPGDSPN